MDLFDGESVIVVSPLSDPTRREEIDMVSACCEAAVRTELFEDFLESILGKRNILEVLDVADQTLEVSLLSFEDDRRPVARRNKLATSEPTEALEVMDNGRSTWKFDITWD